MPLQCKNSVGQVFLGCLSGINYCLFFTVTAHNIVCKLFSALLSDVGLSIYRNITLSAARNIEHNIQHTNIIIASKYMQKTSSFVEFFKK